MVKNPPAIQEAPGSVPGLGRSPGEGNGNPLQYSCLENSRDRGAWLATVHSIAESDMTEQLIHTHQTKKILLKFFFYILNSPRSTFLWLLESFPIPSRSPSDLLIVCEPSLLSYKVKKITKILIVTLASEFVREM